MICLFVVFSLLVVFGVSVLIVCNNVIKVNKVVINNSKIDKDIDIVFISDLHIGRNNKKKELKRIIKKVNEIKGDYLLVGGDMVGSRPFKYYSVEEIKELLDSFNIKKRYFVKGNHDDYSFPLYDSFSILNDECVSLSDNVNLLGLKWEKENNLDNLLDESKFNILLSHYPDRVSEYKKIDLALGAHSHGNQINLPFCKFHHKEKYTRGLYTFKNNQKLYVNKGLGLVFSK